MIGNSELITYLVHPEALKDFLRSYACGIPLGTECKPEWELLTTYYLDPA
ncbi:hypothetical protein IQ255_28540 [Pleurocapsales cyanobacterium LEGE 10410]|nr:hypothetical protein [Pleurocapsales cyanobacterium LEGE 10410]